MHSKGKRIMALAGIVILVGLYITTLLLAIFGNENTTSWFMASIIATVVVPALMWVYSWLYKRLRADVRESARNQQDENRSR